MSRLAKRKSRPGPLTSTQAEFPGKKDENGEGEEYLSLEERIFQRQLEVAIEKSKKETIETDEEPIKKRKSDNAANDKGGKKKKFLASDDEDEDDFNIKPTKKAAAPKVDSTDEDIVIISDENTQSQNHLKMSSESAGDASAPEVLKEKVDDFVNKPRKSPVKRGQRKLIDSSDSEDEVDKKGDKQPLAKAKPAAIKKAVPKNRRKIVDSSEEEEDFSEENISEDEEFTVKKSTKKKTTVVAKKAPETKPVVNKKEEKAKPSPKKPVAPVVIPTKKPDKIEIKKVLPSGPAKPISMPKWNPPAKINSSPSVSFSGMNLSPGIRVGLSRNVRVKPLHKNVKLTP